MLKKWFKNYEFSYINENCMYSAEPDRLQFILGLPREQFLISPLKCSDRFVNANLKLMSHWIRLHFGRFILKT